MISIEVKELFRDEYSRLLSPKDLKEMIECHKLITDVGFKLIQKHGPSGAKSNWDLDGNILFQMSILKSLSIQHLAQSINYKNEIDGSVLKGFYDPFGMFNLVRSQYEAFCNFNNIFIQSKSEDEIKLKYHLWVISGLNYRQRFNAESADAVETKKLEEVKIAKLNELIVLNNCFNQLEEKSQLNILDCIKRRDWQLKIDGQKAYKIGWHEMMMNAGTNKLADGLYTFLSLATHPSNVSVFQFSTMYINKREEFNVEMALELSQTFIAMLIRDFVTYFNLKESIFDKLPLIPQMIINSINTIYRNESFKINEVGKLLS